MVRVKFPIRTGPAWELWPKPSCSDTRPVPSSGTYIGWDDDDDWQHHFPKQRALMKVPVCGSIRQYTCLGTRLLSLDVSSLEDVYWLEDTTARHVLDPKDFGAWSAARQSLPTGKDALQTLKSDLWSAVVKNSKHQDAWTWGGMLIVSVSVCGLVTLAAMTQPSLAPEAKHSLLQYVTGKYLHPPSCKVEWGWEEPHPVGDTMCFTVTCYQRNGQPYPVCDTDELAVNISLGTRKMTAVIELGSGDPAQAHTARVKFTVRTAGVYIIAVTIGGVNISGSPYRRWFTAGRVEARRSRVARAGAGAALVWCAGHARALHLHPRDQYDNPTAAPQPEEGFTIRISPLGGEVDEQLSNSATFQYDAVNERVSMSLCFPQAGLYRAGIYYESVLLHNGEFDCIVLTASDTATLQRNMSSKRHMWCYACRTPPPGKPRRVLCCLSRKQLVLKDYFLGFIPRRATAYRLCPSTKVPPPPSLPRRVLCCLSRKQLVLKDYFLGFIPRRATALPAVPLHQGAPPPSLPRRVLCCLSRKQLVLKDYFLGLPRRVLCCLSRKQLVLKDYFLGFIPRRATAYRLCPSTKVPPPPSLPRRVLCCLSRKQLVLKDYFLGFIPRRATAYRLCPSTKVPPPPAAPRALLPQPQAARAQRLLPGVHPAPRHRLPAVPLHQGAPPPACRAACSAASAASSSCSRTTSWGSSRAAPPLTGCAPPPRCPPPSLPRRVLCCLSRKQLVLKDYFLGFIPRRATAYRLCPSTKVPPPPACRAACSAASAASSSCSRTTSWGSSAPRHRLPAVPLHQVPPPQPAAPRALLPQPQAARAQGLLPGVHPAPRHRLPAVPLHQGAPPPSLPRRVLCCLSRKQLVLKDYFLGFIPRRATAYRLCPSTKVPPPPSLPRRVLCCLSRKQLVLKDYFLGFIPRRATAYRLCPSTKVPPPSLPRRVLCCLSRKQLVLKDYFLGFHPAPRHRLPAGAPPPRCPPPSLPRRVLCCLSRKQLVLKDYFLGFIPRRATAYRLCPSTKLILQPGGEAGAGEFAIEDGVQPRVQLASAQRDLLAATFAQLLLANCGGEDTFKVSSGGHGQGQLWSRTRAAARAAGLGAAGPAGRHLRAAAAGQLRRGGHLQGQLWGTRSRSALVEDACSRACSWPRRSGTCWPPPFAQLLLANCGGEDTFKVSSGGHGQGQLWSRTRAAARAAGLGAAGPAGRHLRAAAAGQLRRGGHLQGQLWGTRSRSALVEDACSRAVQLASAQRDLLAATFAQLLLANCGGEDTFKVSSGGHGQGQLWSRTRAAAVQLASAQRDLLAATFAQLLLANCGGEDTFKVSSGGHGQGQLWSRTITIDMNKQDFFYSEVRKAHARHAHDKLAIRVLRSDLINTSLKATRHFTVADWCRNFDVTFQGEQGVDWGGVRREWFSLLCGRLFEARTGLFAPFHDEPTGLVHPNPDRPKHLKLKHFELAGKLVGKCLYESALGGSYRQLVRARLSRSFLAQLIGLRVHYKYFEQDDPELYLSKIKYLLETDLDSAESVPEIYFAEDVYDASGHLVETHDLLPGGSSIRVTNSTKIKYLDALAQWRLAARCRAETDAFLRGLTLLVPGHLLAIFDENELEVGPQPTSNPSVNTSCWCAARARCLWRTGGRTRWWRGAGGARRERLLGWLGRRRQLERRGARAPAAVHHRALAAAAAGFQVCDPRLPGCVAHWRAHALVAAGAGRGWERLLGWFWAAVANLSAEERARLLQFTTGCSQLPPAGFQVVDHGLPGVWPTGGAHALVAGAGAGRAGSACWDGSGPPSPT
ncbi:hypothetical protein MSG28_006593 [Choristoneura fumiferana]|uniref:Uncharacterized protein n=1 Tax=Choristoneura fumiferana TaxID=7141 RepID=A0ACC0JFK8_CHOFU|nr:hypothetical protein MSG28_006593 [Choristoneura fumiferana]